MNAAHLLRHTREPSIAACGSALAADAMALAAEWSVGNDLAMVSDKTAALENALRIALAAAWEIANDNRETNLAIFLAAYLKGNAAVMTVNRTEADEWAIDEAANDMETAAAALVADMWAEVA